MKRNDQILLIALGSVALLAVFWFLVLSPKRNEASSLNRDIAELHTQLADAQQATAAGEQSRKSFDANYRRLVLLGKAVPADSEQSSLLVQLQRLADRSGVSFETFDLSSDSSSSAPAPATPPPAPSQPAAGTAGSSSTTTSTGATGAAGASATTSATASTSAPATEASASTLPIGASVGPAGLAVMPYDITFQGQFFQIADFLERLDHMVRMRHNSVGVNGRLLTVDGFELKPKEGTGQTGTGQVSATPPLTADLTVTTYLVPPDQGITAGATPSGPAPATPTPTSATPSSASSPSASTSSSAPSSTTASVSP